MSPERPQGMKAFTIVWAGQILSLVGSAMTGFALTIWAWQLTGTATALALVGFFNFAPQVLFSPIAGALVDRWNRKLVMALSDLASGLTTIAILILYTSGNLQIWHLYVAGAISGLFHAFQWPAYSAAISVMIPKKQYARASGMMSMAEFGSGILSPALAGALIGIMGIGGILVIDIVTFVFALGTLLVVAIPQPKVTEEGLKGRGSLLQESLYGFRFILKRPSLLGLQLVFLGGNLMATIAYTLLNPMVLARTGNNAAILALVQSVAGACGVAGGLLVTATGGPKRRIVGVLAGWGINGIGLLVYGMGAGPWVWVPAALLAFTVGPVINSSNQAIWQSKVAPDVQGRVFSVRRLIAQISAPLSMLIAGQAADKITEPLMQDAGSLLAQTFGGVFGTQIGSGMGLLISLSGLLVVVVALIGASIPMIRNVETLLPDHVQDFSGQPAPAD